MYYIKAASGGFIETRIEHMKIECLSRDIKVFKLSNGKVIKTNNFMFHDIVKDVPEGAICGEVLWEYKEKDLTDIILLE
jgi:hypothetical protein